MRASQASSTAPYGIIGWLHCILRHYFCGGDCWPGMEAMETMTDLRITTTRGTDMVLDEATVQGFQTSLRGALLRPGDADYDEARKVWNANVDKRPALIACCAGVSGVINAVNIARINHLYADDGCRWGLGCGGRCGSRAILVSEDSLPPHCSYG